MGFRLKDTGIQQVRRKAREDFDKGAIRRAFQAAMTRLYCQDNPRIAERKFGWSRDAVQKGSPNPKPAKPLPIKNGLDDLLTFNACPICKRTFARLSRPA